jgi:hypothetical protein
MSPGQQRRDERRQAERQGFALDDPERRQAEDEVDRRVREEKVRCGDPEDLEIEQQRRAEKRGAADGAIDADDPEDAAARLRLRHRHHDLLDRRRERRGGGGHHGQVGAGQRGRMQAGSPQVRPAGPGTASFCGR